MFMDRLLSQNSAPLLEQVIKFTAARHRLIAENMANVDTVGYRQKDLSVPKFQAMLAERASQRAAAGPEGTGFSDIEQELEYPVRGILFHDGNNRSMEQLTTDLAKNAMFHNIAIELLRKQYQAMEMALKERIA